MGANESTPVDPNPPTTGPRSAVAHPSSGERAAVFGGFDAAPARERRAVFSALMARAVAAAQQAHTLTQAQALAQLPPPPPPQQQQQQRQQSQQQQEKLASLLLRGHCELDAPPLEPPACVKVFISCGSGDDWAWERNALVKDVWPFLRRFCKVLNLDFEPIDRTWNVPNPSLEVNQEKAEQLLWECIGESAGPAFFCFLGDRYGSAGIPQSIPASEFEAILESLANHRSNEEEGNVQDFLKTWFVKDTNQTPTPVYSLLPVEHHYPGIYSTDNFAIFVDATSKWESAKSRLMKLLKDGSESVLTKDNDVYKKLHGSETEFEISVASTCRAKDMVGVDKDKFLDKFFCFRRSFVKPPEGVADTFYFDDPTLESDPTAMAKLATKIRPKRSYSVPWNTTDAVGFSPSSDKSHAAYLKTFCDDAARLLAENILKHYSATIESRAINQLTLEMDRQRMVVNELARNFVGRKQILETVSQFLEAPDNNDGVFVLYGPSGVGKSAILARTAQILADAKSYAVVSRFIGKTEQSSSLKSLISSICLQISQIYGIDELKAAITQEIEALADLVDNTAGASSAADNLFEILEKWPPVSMPGLKLGLEIAMSLATSETPLVLIIDGLHELDNESDSLNIDWLPSVVPPNVKIVLSALPMSKKQSLFLSVCAKFPSATAAMAEDFADGPTIGQYHEVPAFSEDEVSSLIAILLSSNHRALTDKQLEILTAKCKFSSMPLYVKTTWNLCASKWTSSHMAMQRDLKAETIPGLFEDYLDVCEMKWGRVFVARCLSYITAARNGLSKNELTDVLSCDADVLSELFKAQEPAILRLNMVTVGQLLDDLKGCFTYKTINGIKVIVWSNIQFKTVIQERYLYGERQSSVHRALASYWRDKPDKDHGRSAKHFIFKQTLLLYGKPNDRRISSVAWHLLNSGVSGVTEAVKTLQDISYLGAAIDAGLLDEVMSCYKYALESMGNNVYAAQLTEYYRFLVINYKVLANSPRSLVPLAANLYSTSVVSGDVRSWIKAQAPDLNWIEWVNRPTSRGEPIAILKPEDVSQGITVTFRDSFANLVAVTGICESDGLSALSLYDMNSKPTSVVPDERAKLINFVIVDLADDEQGLPLVCSFSRGGKAIALASRSLVFYNTSGLSLAGAVTDPTLPEGDIITAIAWTKDDGCVVTSSDGSEPGRIVLWDAGSFSLLRVIKSQYPRQPICSAYSTIGFWDEYRELFILLDVDELASDAESGLFLQYIPTKSHCDPPPDGCARFALAHRAPLVLVGNDDGLGYTLIDYRAKRPVGHVDIDIDTVRYVAISSDGTKIAIIPHEGKVIHVLGLTDSTRENVRESVKDGDLVLFGHLGTVLGSEVEQPTCLFSRNRLCILTDGEFGQTQVWSVNDLGDHSTVRYHSMLPALMQGLGPVINGQSCVGWAVPENRTEVSFSDAKGKAKVKSFDVSIEDDDGVVSKDVLVGIAGHPEKPFTAVVTDQGYLSLLYNDNISADMRGWIKGLWNTKRVGDGLLATYSVWRDDDYTSPSCVAFLTNYGVHLPATVNGTTVEYLTIATGHEDGSLRLWEWSSIAEDLVLLHHMPFKFGRITSIIPANLGSKTMAITIDDRTVVIWDGLSPNVRSVSVIISPDHSPPPADRITLRNSKFRRSASSVWSTAGLSNEAIDRPTVVAFSNLSDKIFATGESAGSVTLWSLEAKMKRSLITHPDKVASFIPIVAIGWSLDDGTVVSLCEDKRVTVHGSETGELIWIHDIWMVPLPVKIASFVSGARQLSILDVYGSLTIVNIHGKWPSSKSIASKTRLGALRSAITSSATKLTSILNVGSSIDEVHPITTSNISPASKDQESFAVQEWDAAISGKLSQNRAEAHTKSSDLWEYTTGSGSHGHVALLRLDSGLYRGTYEVICEVEIPEISSPLRSSTSGGSGIPLKFVCGSDGGESQDLKLVVDPELEMIRGFTRYFPVEEQKQLGGMGKVSLRLGYLKVLCKITTCYIDLKRIPGEGEVFKLGTVHFIPVDPVLYSPSYKYPPELKNAFEAIGRNFRDFEDRHRRRGSLLNSVISDRLSSQTSVPELKAALIRATSLSSDIGSTIAEVPDVLPASVPKAANVTPGSVPSVPAPAPATMMTPNQNTRMSILQPLSHVVANVSGLLSKENSRVSIFGREETRSPSVAKEAHGVPKFEDIQREMAEARRRANEEAKRLEEEDERLAAAAAKDREMRAIRNEFERNAKESIAKMVKGESPVPNETLEEVDENEVEFLESEEEKLLAQSIMAKMVEIEASMGIVVDADIIGQDVALAIETEVNNDLTQADLNTTGAIEMIDASDENESSSRSTGLQNSDEDVETAVQNNRTSIVNEDISVDDVALLTSVDSKELDLHSVKNLKVAEDEPITEVAENGSETESEKNLESSAEADTENEEIGEAG